MKRNDGNKEMKCASNSNYVILFISLNPGKIHFAFQKPIKPSRRFASKESDVPSWKSLIIKISEGADFYERGE